MARRPRTGSPRSRVGGARKKFREDLHRREHGKFADKPGAGDDAPRRRRQLVGEQRLKTSGVTADDKIVVLSSRVRAYREVTTVREFVDNHPKGRAYALRKLAADQKKGAIGFKGAEKVKPPPGKAKPSPTGKKLSGDAGEKVEPKTYLAVDRSKLRPVDPSTDGGVKDTDYVFSHLKKYPENARVVDFVRDHPKGEAFARRVLQNDLKQGRVSIERPSAEFPAPAPRATRKTITDEKEWHAVSFRTDDAVLSRAIKAAPPVQRIAPIDGKGAYAQDGRAIHMDGLEASGHTAQARTTWRHEYGHHLDSSHVDAVNGYGFASAGPGAQRAMWSDADALVRQTRTSAAETLAGQLRGQTDEALNAALERGGVKLTVGELRTIAGPQHVPAAAAALISKDAKAYLAALELNRPSEIAATAHGFSSDAFEALTQTRIGGWAAGMDGHGAAYYAKGDAIGKGFTALHGAEVFANYIALRGSEDMSASYKAFRHLAPETAKAYDEILASYRSR